MQALEKIAKIKIVRCGELIYMSTISIPFVIPRDFVVQPFTIILIDDNGKVYTPAALELYKEACRRGEATVIVIEAPREIMFEVWTYAYFQLTSRLPSVSQAATIFSLDEVCNSPISNHMPESYICQKVRRQQTAPPPPPPLPPPPPPPPPPQPQPQLALTNEQGQSPPSLAPEPPRREVDRLREVLLDIFGASADDVAMLLIDFITLYKEEALKILHCLIDRKVRGGGLC